MSTNFTLGMDFVGLHEWGNRADGAYTNDPADPGGETKFGIAKRSHPNEDIKNLTIDRAFELYQTEYWNAHSLDAVPLPLCVAYFDSYIQHNPNKVKLMIDVGGGDLRTFIEARRQYYKKVEILHPEEVKFDKGWMNRCNDLFKYCTILMQG